MRFIIHEQPYEQLIATGSWRYEQDGRITGAVEHWRLTTALDEYQFLRIDLDARQTSSGTTYLYHLVFDEHGRPIRLQYRIWELSSETVGNVLLEQEEILVTSGTGDSRFEVTIGVPEGYKFWFPSSTALGLLARSSMEEATPAVVLEIAENSDEDLLLSPCVTTLRQEHLALDPVDSSGAEVVRIMWEDQQGTIWLDRSNWPLRVACPGGVSAVEEQLIHYRRISKPGEPVITPDA